MIAVLNVWRRSFGTFNVTSPAFVSRLCSWWAGLRITTSLGPLVALRVVQPVPGKLPIRGIGTTTRNPP